MQTNALRFNPFQAALVAAFASLVVQPVFSTPAAADPAAGLLRARDSIEIAQAGPYVAPGTFRVQVAAKLGRADAILPDGTWLYHGHRVENSEAHGTLVVRFGADGRVSSLRLVTPAVVAALRADSRRPGASALLATR